jgi:hypothetical protein
MKRLRAAEQTGRHPGDEDLFATLELNLGKIKRPPKPGPKRTPRRIRR